jgi:type VI secretion system secreted protein VgrG
MNSLSERAPSITTAKPMDSMMASDLPWATWRGDQRLYRLEAPGALGELLVERFVADEHIDQGFVLRVDLLSPLATLELQPWLGRRVGLLTALADGRTERRSAVVTGAQRLASDGGFTRYRLRLEPWVALLAHRRQSRVWQDKALIDIVGDVLQPYAEHGTWRWGEHAGDGDDRHNKQPAGALEDLQAFLAQGPGGGVLPYCVQYRESDLAFLKRLLADAGLGWRLDEAAQAERSREPTPRGQPSREEARHGPASADTGGAVFVVFADSRHWPRHASAHGPLGGLRLQRASAVDTQDALQAFGALHRVQPAASTTLRWDYRSKRAVAASVPTAPGLVPEALSSHAGWLEHHDDHEPAFDTAQGASTQEAQHRALLAQQAAEARHRRWLGRSTVRGLRSGQRFKLLADPLARLAGDDAAGREYAVVSLQTLGINNLPRELKDAMARRAAGLGLGPDDAPDDAPDHEFDTLDALDALDAERDPASSFDADPLDAIARDPALRAQAERSGHANRFECLPATTPWRPLRPSAATALGLQTALVVGPDGSAQPRGADELHTDRLGRIRVRFHWQDPAGGAAAPSSAASSSCWVRVAQAWAGAGIGCQFIPRIGQEVLVQFLEGRIERPVVIGALANGQGEGGVSPTPGGRAPSVDDRASLQAASDHRPGGQSNRIGSGSGGHAPAWHAGAAGEHGHAGALSGFKSKEFGGAGWNQLVFDDSPGQARVQLASTQHASQLNLGHLVHQADNHRGGARGEGFELRTDAYGAVRARQGLLITSYGLRAAPTGPAEPAGDNAPGMALLKQALSLAQTFQRAARTHQTTALAADQGSVKARASVLSPDEAPLKALHTSASGMVAAHSIDSARADAAQRATAAQDGKLPHSAEPIVAISAKAGLAAVAGQDLQLASGDTVSLQAGAHLELASGQALRIQTGQGLGVLGGAIEAGAAGVGASTSSQAAAGQGLTLIAGSSPVSLQAHAGPAQVAAQGDVMLQSATAHIDWAAATKITLATAGGACVTIEATGITVECPRTIIVRASQKSFVGPKAVDHLVPSLPKSVCVECLMNARAQGSPFAVI